MRKYRGYQNTYRNKDLHPYIDRLVAYQDADLRQLSICQLTTLELCIKQKLYGSRKRKKAIKLKIRSIKKNLRKPL